MNIFLQYTVTTVIIQKQIEETIDKLLKTDFRTIILEHTIL